PRHRWLAAVASAAAVALFATAVVAVSAGLHGTPPAGTAAPPRYYVETSFQGLQLYVRATAAGRVTAVVPDPRPARGRFLAIAAAGHGVFFTECARLGGAAGTQARIYRFRVTADGRVTGLAPVPGGNLGRLVAGSMAATRHGSRLALGIEPSGVRRGDHPAEIIVLDPRTGARATWRGGLAPRGQDQRTLRIGQRSWTADGQQLAYLAAWTCRQPPASARASCPDVGPLGYCEEVRSLAPAGRGGRLSSGRLLLRVPAGDIERVVISPDGALLTAATVSDLIAWSGHPSREVTVAQVSAQTGQAVRVLYRVRTGPWTA
ncbi:MAG: hypothetical protein ACRDPO_11900, partial [Streptosporangiaceae bacterium]